MPKRTAAVEEVDARLIRRGDIIELSDDVGEGNEVVVGITIVFHLSSNQTMQAVVGATVRRVPPEDLSPLVAAIESTPDEQT